MQSAGERVAVTIGVYNEQETIAQLLQALVDQERPPDQVVVVDDGSTDDTPALVRAFAARHRFVQYVRQENAGPAAARNHAWRCADADLCVFTDGDCVPDRDWISTLLPHFADPTVGAVGGTYRTINTRSLLARFIGEEIAFKYRDTGPTVDVHGSYNLAVRRSVLAEVGGFDESYKKPSGEDWDLTFKISRRHRIVFERRAIVGHYHPTDWRAYYWNQVQRGVDRVRLYSENPALIRGDSYTSPVVKYQVLATGALIPALLALLPIFPFSWSIPAALVAFLVGTALVPFPFYLRRSAGVAVASVPIQLARNLAWFHGLVKGALRLRRNLPQSDNWNQYWSGNKDSRFTKTSWSKRRIMRILSRHLQPGMAVLDAGCGSGYFSRFFIGRGCRTWSLDYSSDALEITRRLTEGGSESYLQEDLLSDAVREKYRERFDLVFTDGLLEHFTPPQIEQILSNFHAWLKPGGLVVTFVPNRHSWWELVRPIFMPGIHEDPFTMRRLKAAHEAFGIVEDGGINVLPAPLSPDRALGSRLGMLLYVVGRKGAPATVRADRPERDRIVS